MRIQMMGHVDQAAEIVVSQRFPGKAGCQINFGNEVAIILDEDQIIATVQHLQAFIDRHMNVRTFPTRRPVLHTGPGTGGDAA